MTLTVPCWRRRKNGTTVTKPQHSTAVATSNSSAVSWSNGLSNPCQPSVGAAVLGGVICLLLHGGEWSSVWLLWLLMSPPLLGAGEPSSASHCFGSITSFSRDLPSTLPSA